MDRKLTWLASVLALVLISAPALIAQNTWVVSDDDDAGSSYALFGMEDSAFLGVTMEEETDHEEGGARITSVVEGSPAEEAGLEEGDIIVGFGKDTIRGPVGLTKRIRGLEAGDEIEITVLRDGRKRSFDVELGKRSAYSTQWSNIAPQVLEQLRNLQVPDVDFDMEALEDQLEGLGQLGELGKLNNYSFFDSKEWQGKLSELGNGFTFDCEDGDCNYGGLYFSRGRPRLGVQLTETTPELREHLGGSEDAGVLVSKVIKGSAAEDAGIAVGDLIVDVDGDEISSTNDLRKALSERDGEVFEIEVIRGGRSISLSVTLEAEDDDRPTGPRAYSRVPHPSAPALVAPQVARRLVPQIRERVRLAPVAVTVATACRMAIAPVAVPVPVGPAAVVAPELNVAPMLAPLPQVPVAPRPVLVLPTKDDVI